MKEPTIKDKMRLALVNALASGHSHAEVKDFYTCKSCLEKALAWKAMVKKFGFTDPTSFLRWNMPEPENKEPIDKGDCFFCKEKVFVIEGKNYNQLRLKHPITGNIEGPFPIHGACKKKNAKTKIPVLV